MQAHASLLNRQRVERLHESDRSNAEAAACPPGQHRRWGVDQHAAALRAATPRLVPRENLIATNAKKSGSHTFVVGAV